MHIGGKWVTVTLHILTESLSSLACSLKFPYYTNFHIFTFFILDFSGVTSHDDLSIELQKTEHLALSLQHPVLASC